MEDFLYAMLLLGVGWTIGSAMFGSYIFLRVRKYVAADYRHRYLHMSIAKAAYALSSAILMYRIIEVGGVEKATPIGWIYAGLAFASGYAFSVVAKTGVDELAQHEVEAWGDTADPRRERAESNEQRFTNLEGRVTVEETRNDASELRSREHRDTHTPPAHREVRHDQD
jgi:hypothetical protein